jgi:glyoxylase-like metal-dependent hydrolase (beta-lactamase superfamily II)
VIVTCLNVGQIQTNCYVIADRKDGTGAIVDPGGDAATILQAAQDLDISYVINTHAHFDHTLANGEVLEALEQRQQKTVELVAHPKTLPLLAVDGGAGLFGLSASPSPTPDRLVDDGDLLHLGSMMIEIVHTPGHSPGSISLYCAEAKTVFVGDVLFSRGIGRTDLPGGNWHTLMDSITKRLWTLPEETTVYPGHGPATTIGEEKKHNPFLT